MRKKVVISGSGGFLGGNLVAYFLNQSLQVVALFHKELQESKLQAEKRNIQKSELLSRIPLEEHGSLSFVDGDITNKDDMDVIFKENEPDALVHAAAMLIAPSATDESASKRFHEVNEAKVLADTVAEYQKIKNNFYCMLISTIYVFDLQAEEINEETPHKPVNPYAKSKEAAELYWKLKVTNLAIVWPPQIYGAYQFTPAIMPKIMKKLLFNDGAILALNGAINPIHIKNIVKLIYALCISSEMGFYCISGDGVMSLAQIATQLQKAAIDFLSANGKNPFPAFTISDSAISTTPKINDANLIRFFNLKFPEVNPHESIAFDRTAQEIVTAMFAHAEISSGN